MKKIYTVLIMVLVMSAGHSQAIFVTKGKIEFERRVNAHRLYFTGETGTWVDEMKKLVPPFKTDYFDLVFNEGKTLYKPSARETEAAKVDFFSSPAQDNIVYKDLDKQTSVSLKSIYETKFLLNDSLRHLKWRLESEVRTIAGFECRKAVTTICDSVVVVAFYTDQIINHSGPESFSGLPGMILGLAIPRLYTTWFATKLENIEAVDEAKIVAPAKGKKATAAEMSASVLAAIKNWGDRYRDRSMWAVNL